MKFPFVKFPKVKEYLPSRLNARAPRFPITPAAGIPKKELPIAIPEEKAPTVPQTQLVAKHVFATILLAQQKFIPALPVVLTLSTKIYEFANVGTCDKTPFAVVIKLLNGVGAMSKYSAILITRNKINELNYSIT